MQALNDMREQAGNHIEPLPPIVDAVTFTTPTIPEPPQVIYGILHRGSKLVYGGSSKAFKSWVFEDMSLAISTGGDWLGYQTTQGNVLYINFELPEFAIQRRLKAIADDRDIAIPKTLTLWNLRGFCRPLPELLPDLLRQIKGECYSLIVLDPIYKMLQCDGSSNQPNCTAPPSVPSITRRTSARSGRHQVSRDPIGAARWFPAFLIRRQVRGRAEPSTISVTSRILSNLVTSLTYS